MIIGACCLLVVKMIKRMETWLCNVPAFSTFGMAVESEWHNESFLQLAEMVPAISEH